MTIGIVAHDGRKPAMVQWVKRHQDRLSQTRLKSGPLGGDQQLGALIAEGKLDMLVFFVDPLSPHPHDVDVKALLRLATLYNVPFACNTATADLLLAR